MSREKVRELLRRRSTKIGSVVLAATLVFGGSMWAWKDSQTTVPELVTYVDMADEVVIEDEETPLAAPKVTKSTKVKKKKIKLKKASKKTYVKNGKTKTKKSTKTTKKGSVTTTVETVTETSVKTQFKKGSKVKTQITTIVTTTTTTETTAGGGGGTAATTPAGGTTAATPTATAEATTAATTAAATSGQVAVETLASRADARVLNAFNTLGCTVTINAGVNYSGQFDARVPGITLKVADDTIYHELGHFLGFIAGNYDRGSEFQGIFNREKSLYTAYNAAYVLSNASEYFAESFRNYTLDPAGLQASRPETYGAIVKALSMVTDAQVNNIKNVYSAIWNQ